jgi:hypothetical protein
MAIRQTRIFVPSADPLADWAETVFGFARRLEKQGSPAQAKVGES